MRTLEDAKKSIKMVKLSDEQKARSQHVWEWADRFVELMWQTAKPCPELTKATRSLEEALLWHQKAIANENS
jgi:hypothetical protein